MALGRSIEAQLRLHFVKFKLIQFTLKDGLSQILYLDGLVYF